MELNDEKNFTLVDSNGTSTLAFLINEPENGTNCATIQKDKAYLHMAILRDEELLVSKEQSNVTYRTLRTEDSVMYQEVKYTPNFKRPISIIDPEIADEVRPVLYFDEEANMVRARVKLLPNKSYITLEVQRNEAGALQTNYAICTFE